MKGVYAGGRIGGAKRRHRNNFKTPWQESLRRLRGDGYLERKPRSRNQREVGWQDGKSECWGGYRRRPGGRMISCGRQRCWEGDKGRPGGRMKSFGSYGGE